MVKLMCIVGARPNFMKAAPVIEALTRRAWASITLLHTGQHYSREMSALFFEELGLPKPDLDLQVGSGSHGQQTGEILIRLEPVLERERPDWVIVFGDVNSTAAAALCAAKMNIRVAHVEAGLRSFDRTMPEELNRIVTDHLSDLLFTTERSGTENLLREGIDPAKIAFVGNVMVDTLLKHVERAAALKIARRYGLAGRSYGVLTLHRPGNVDDPDVLASILEAVEELGKDLPILFPCHVRTRERLEQRPALLRRLAATERIRLLDPLGYLEFLSLMGEARLVLTDSGGIQEETTVLQVPCLTLRDNTERPVTVEQGTNVLVGSEKARIVEAGRRAIAGPPASGRIPELWDGQAADRIAAVFEQVCRSESFGPAGCEAAAYAGARASSVLQRRG